MHKQNYTLQEQRVYEKLIHRGPRLLTNSNPIPTVIDEENIVQPCPENLSKFWDQFLIELKTKSPNYLPAAYSAIVRVVVPYLRGPSPQGSRTSESEKAAAIAFLEKCSVSDLKIVFQNLDYFFDQQDWPKEKRKQLKFHLNQMLQFALARNWIEPDPENPELIYRFKEAHGARVRQDMKDFRAGTRKNSETVILGSSSDDFVTIPKLSIPKIELNWRFAFSSYGLLMFWVALAEVQPDLYLANQEFDQELSQLAFFMRNRLKLSEATVDSTVGYVCRLLGWMYRKQGVGLAAVRLTKVVPFVQMKYNLSECQKDPNLTPYLAKMVNEATARDESRNVGEQIAEQIEDYIAWGNVSDASAVQIYNAIVNLGKFIYQKETNCQNFTRNNAFNDIPLFEVLRERRSTHEASDRSNSSNSQKRRNKREQVIPYLQLIEVLEKVRLEATLKFRYSHRKNRCTADGRPKTEKIWRSDTGIAASFQKFIIIALMISMPPRRPKEYYQAKIGKTLIKGLLENGDFIPVEKMKNPSTALYYLFPEHYKTIDTYGDVCIPIANIMFPDKTRFYDYLEKWITQWRPIFVQDPNNDFLFVQRDGRPMTSSGFGQKVEHIFWRFAGIKMPPKNLRHAFETYTQVLGLNEAEKQASIVAMGHSAETKRQYYDLRHNLQVMQPILDLNHRIVEQELRNFNRSKLFKWMNCGDEND